VAIQPGQNPTERQQTYDRNPLLLLGGSILIGMALALLLFGGGFLNGDEDQPKTLTLPQVPELEDLSPDEHLLSTSQLVEVGDTPHNFTLKDLDGRSHELNALRGQPVVLNFWATWCVPCRVEMPELQAAFERHQDDGLVIMAMDFDEPADKVRRFFYEDMGLSFTPLLDEDGLVAQQYGVFNFPSTFFVSPQGVVMAVHRGPMVREQIEDYLSEIIPVLE
jgi:peroxiredoxin